MRLWSLHPQYLDRQGLVALWREALLARAVLRNQTRGYHHHPQLERFKAHATPRLAINAYLDSVHVDATRRGYRFDRSKIGPVKPVAVIPVTTGQIAHEWWHLMRKLELRNPALHAHWHDLAHPRCHPMFDMRPGPVAPWERVGDGAA